MKNLNRIKELVFIIRKNKQEHKNNQKNNEYTLAYKSLCELKDLSLESRYRTIARALQKRKVDCSILQTMKSTELEELLNKYHIETNLRPQTYRLSPPTLLEYLKEE